MRLSDKWEQIRAKGKNWYLWHQGVFTRGLITGTIYSFLLEVMRHGFILSRFTSKQFFFNLLIAIVIFSVSGFIWAQLTWKMYERKYLDQQTQKK